MVAVNQNFRQDMLAFQNSTLQAINSTSYVASLSQTTSGIRGLLTLAASSNIRMLLANPSASGVQIAIPRIALALDSTILTLSVTKSLFGNFIANPTGNLPTTAMNIAQQHIGNSSTSLATMFCDTGSALTGGTQLHTFPIISNVRTVYQEGSIILDPGQSVGLNVATQGIGGFAAEIYYYEYAP